LKRLVISLALAALASLSLTSCSGGPAANSVINVAEIGSLYSINTDVADAVSAHNQSELAHLTTASFYQLDEAGNLAANTKLGTVEVVTQSPFTVKYEIAEGVAWSDGVAIDAADLALSFAAGRELQEIDFGSVRAGTGIQYAKLASKPAPGDRAVTLTFEHPVADFQNALTLAVPAHVVGVLADSSWSSSTDAKKYVLESVSSESRVALSRMARAYQKDFLVESNLSVKSNDPILTSSGAFKVEKFSGPTTVTVLANGAFAAGEPSKVERVNLKFFTDATAAIAAMSAGDVDISAAEDSGLASISEIKTLAEAIQDRKVSTFVAAGSVAEQIIFNFGPDSIFAEGSRAISAEPNASLTARVAFLNAIPKSRIIDSVSSRYTAKASGSFVFGSDSPSYKAVVQDNGSNVYPFQDVEKAGELMKSLGADTPVTVRVVFDTDNPRALAEWTLLEARCESAGFTLVSLASADPAEVIESGEFDVFIGTRDLVATPGADLYSLTGSSFVGFQSDYIDGKLAKLAQAKEGLQQQAILKDVDTELFKVAFGMPLYEVPSMLVVADRVSGFKPSPHASSATWGYFNWSQVSSK
jgi:peptide/nickel transport system substrate-binding protein